MLVKCGKFYACWNIGKKRFRRAFKNKKDAIAHQLKMRAARDRKNKPGTAKPSAPPRPDGPKLKTRRTRK